MAADSLEPKRELIRKFMEIVPHNRALSIELLHLVDSEAAMKLPYDRKLAGSPDTGVLHGGAISSLMDACCGAAVFIELSELARITTLDLRIDYLKPATPGRDVIARATCYKMTQNVAFVRCAASHESESGERDAIAAAAGTFMIIRNEDAS